LTTSGAHRRRVAVVVIHGVANQEPGDTARALGVRLAEGAALPRPAVESWRVIAPSLPAMEERGPLADLPDGDLGRPFRSFVLRDLALDEGATSADLWEVAWADLSRPGRSAIAVLVGLFGLVTSLPAIGLRERKALKLPVTLERWLEWATFFAKAVMLPSVAIGLVLALSLVALPCSRDRAEVIRIALAVVHGLLPPFVVPLLAMRAARPQVGADAQRRWSVAPGLVALGATLGGATYVGLPDELLAVLPAMEVVIGGVVATTLGLVRFLDEQRERISAGVIACVLVSVWLASTVHNALTFQLRDAPSEGIALARSLVYASTFAIEFAYVGAALGFVLALGALFVGVSPSLGTILGSKGSERVRVHALRTIAMSHALPLVMLLFLALPLVSAVVVVLSHNELIPNTEVRLQVVTSLGRFAFIESGEQVMHADDLLMALVRASGTHLLIFALLVAAWIAGIATFVLLPAARAELGLFPDPEDEPNEASVERPRQREVLDRWLERGTYVVVDWIRNGALAIGAIIFIGFVLEVGVFLADRTGLMRALVAPIRDAWREARGTSAEAATVGDYWNGLARISGWLVLGMGGVVAGPATLLAPPSRARERTQPLWPILDVILDVTRYLEPDRRAKILARTHAVLAEVLREDAAYDEVVLVTHSQGTLIGADVLRMTATSRGEQKPRLVTMGSPLANLYHRLLPGSFEWVQDAVEEPNYLGVASWTNLYGGGDAVGRSVCDTELMRLVRGLTSDPEIRASTNAEDRAKWIVETNVGSIGHTSYLDASGNAGRAVREGLLHAICGAETQVS